MNDSFNETYTYLVGKYNRTVIGKQDLAQELGIASSTLDLYMQRGYGAPRYKKLGTKANSKVVFNLVDVAKFLSSNMIETL
jgi:hypothetical protein